MRKRHQTQGRPEPLQIRESKQEIRFNALVQVGETMRWAVTGRGNLLSQVPITRPEFPESGNDASAVITIGSFL
jgi:hypothetical protein